MPRCRGYITSSYFRGMRVPQHIQNLVIRDFCSRHGIQYLLSATEYALDDSYLILSGVLREIEYIEDIEGIVFYSVFQLPLNREFRTKIYDRTLKNGKVLYFSVEGIVFKDKLGSKQIEDILSIYDVMDNTQNMLEVVEYLKRYCLQS